MPLPTEKSNILGTTFSVRQWKQSPNLFIAPSLYVDKKLRTELSTLLAIRILIANSRARWRVIFKALTQDVDTE